MMRSFCLEPRQLPPAAAASIRRLQPLFHKLYVGLARDVDFLSAALAPPSTSAGGSSSSSNCAWLEHELATFRELAPSAAAKPHLLLPNSVYLQPAAGSALDPGLDRADDAQALTLSVGNVQAGEPYQMQLVHTLQCAEHGESVQSGPLRHVCRTLAQAARLVHPSAPCVAILAKPLELLALRTRCDVRGLGESLRTEHGVQTVLYLSIDELAQATVSDQTGDLCLGPHRISVVYIRYDFSHPFGEHVRAGDEQVMHAGERGALLQREWRAVEAMERSTAVLSSSLGSRLAHRRRVQHALVSQPGALERFVNDDEARMLRAVLPMQWAVGGDGYESEAAEARARFEADPERFVAKSALRPRTGSNATQDRKASGGVTLTSAESIRQVLASPAAAWFLLYPKVTPQPHNAHIVHDGGVHQFDMDDTPAASEVAAYGTYLSAPLDDGGEVLVDACAGLGARTRPADPAHPLAAGLGYGALSCVAVDDGS